MSHRFGQTVRQSDGDGQADGLGVLLYRRSGGDRWSDRLVKMADEWSDDDGQSDGWGKMVYRQLDIARWSDGLIMGLTGGVTDAHVKAELMGCQMDWSYDGWMGMTDGLAVSQTDRATDGWVNLQTDGVTDGLVVQQTDVLMDGHVCRQVDR